MLCSWTLALWHWHRHNCVAYGTPHVPMYLCTHVPMYPRKCGVSHPAPMPLTSCLLLKQDYIRQVFPGRIESDTIFPGRIFWSDYIRSDYIDVKSIFARPTKCACTMPIVVPEEIFLLALHPPLARRYVRSRRQLLCLTKCAFPHCSSTRPAKRAHHHHHHHRIWNP